MARVGAQELETAPETTGTEEGELHGPPYGGRVDGSSVASGRVAAEVGLQDIEIETRGQVTVLWMSREEAHNALSVALVDGLIEALSAYRDRVIVLAARGSHFCAGGDLKEGLGASEVGALAGHRTRGRYAELLTAIRTHPMPVIAAVQGDALGGGLGLVAAADLAIAGRSVAFGTPEIRVGLFPWMISVLLQREVPKKALAQLIYTGGRWSASRAVELGLINELCDDPVERAVGLAGDIAARSPAVVALGKTALRETEEMSVSHGLSHMAAQLSLNLTLDDAREGIQAFVERREPNWSGR